MHEQFNLDKGKIAVVNDIKAHIGKDKVRLSLVSKLDGIEVNTEYSVDKIKPASLIMRMTISRYAEGDALHMLGSMVLHPRGALQPYTLDTLNGEYSIGFQQPLIDTTKITEILAAVSPADLQILVGSNHIQPSISYGVKTNYIYLTDSDGNEEPLKPFLIASETFSIFGLFSEPFYSFSRKPSPLTFLRGQFMDIEQGETLKLEREIILGKKSDVASVTNQLYQGRWITGQLDTNEAGVEIRHNQQPISFARVDKKGRFRFRLPIKVTEKQCELSLNIITAWSTKEQKIDCQLQDLGLITTADFATVKLPSNKIMNLIFKGVNGTADPLLRSELTGLTVGGQPLLTGPENNRISLAGIEQDIHSIQLAPGEYRVIASRGIEYDLQEKKITIKAGDVIDLDLTAPQRAVNTIGMIGADFHVHSAVSMDSSLQPAYRVIDFIAQGGEVLVSTEHNITYDIQPVIEQLGLADQLLGVTGVELTGMARSLTSPTTIGHSNVFPVQADSTQFMGGTIPFEGKRLGQVISDYKQQFPDSVFQLNHPRTNTYDSDVAFFNHLSIGAAYDPDKNLTAEPNQSLIENLGVTAPYRDIDFDAIELLNGEVMHEYELNRKDWFSLLKQGFYKVATANSDSHASVQLVAMPRTYVLVGDVNIADLKVGDVIGALRKGLAFGSNGPIVSIDLDGVLPGQTFVGNHAELTVRVDSAPWININSLKVFINGELSHELDIVRKEVINISLGFTEDSFITIEVHGDVSELYKIVAPGHKPLAFSNPIFVDSDSDGYKVGGVTDK
jgi:hypothetical protein